MYDFRDGQICREHPLFSVDDHALQLIIYTDEVETANPLGSYRGQHKLSKIHLDSLSRLTYFMLLSLYSCLLLPYWEY